MVFEKRGTDVNVMINGRKRQLIVDTDGGIWLANVHASNKSDGATVLNLLADISCQNNRLVKLTVIGRSTKYLPVR